jgi:hypothetical protein
MIPNLKTEFVNNCKLGFCFIINFQINKRNLIFEEIIIILFVNVEYHSRLVWYSLVFVNFMAGLQKNKKNKGPKDQKDQRVCET